MARGGVIWARHTATVLLGLALCALAFLAMAWNLGVPPHDPRVSGSLADDPTRVFGRLPSELRSDGSGVSDAYRQEVMRAARRDPLNEAPYIVAALRSGSQGRYIEALRLLEVARGRNPRNSITRVMLLETYLRQARAKEVVAELAVLGRLSSGASQKLLPLIVGLVENVSTREAAMQGLRGSSLDYSVMRALAERQADPALIMSLRPAMTGEQQRSDSDRRQVSGLIDPYLSAGRWAEAAELWRHFYARHTDRLRRVTDQGFFGTPGPPFGWQLTRSDSGLVEKGSTGLQIVHFGRKGWVVVRQAMLLKPGTYRLGYVLGGQKDNLPDLVWRVDCAASGTTLLDLPFQRQNIFGISATDIFTVPAEACPAQWLALATRVGDTTETRSAVIRSVEISNLGDR
jgi:hypothetical protein